MSGRPRRPRRVTAPSDEVLLATLENKRVWSLTARYVLIILALCALLWAATPLAAAIAGKDTTFNVSVTIALTVVLGGTTVLGYGTAGVQKRKVTHLERRNHALERRLEELQRTADTSQAATK